MPAYAFLAHPPPSRPLPAARRRSATASSIAAWASRVTPGEPAAPSPPASAASLSSKLSLSPRRPSVSAAPARAVSASFLALDTPTPSRKHFKPADLAALGYAYAL
ncbi:hypothetical protein K488DRAFT_74778, partial [Vararia minispora EC-137]